MAHQGAPRWRPCHAEALRCPCLGCSFVYTSPYCLQPNKPDEDLCLVRRAYFNVYLIVNLRAGLRTGPALWDGPCPSAWLYFSQPLIDVNLLLNLLPPLNLLSFFSFQLTKCFSLSFSFLLSSGPSVCYPFPCFALALSQL